MVARIITIAQRKGGAGKTTLAVQLGVSLAKQGAKVAMLDCDPQASLYSWYQIRQKSGLNLVYAAQAAGWRLASDIESLKEEHDYLLVDSPPHAETDARIAVRAAGLTLIPVQPSALDVWAMRPTVELARKEKTPVLLVFNRVPPKFVLPEEIADLPRAQSTLGNRTAFSSSMGLGLGVVEHQPKGKAAQEINALAKEIMG